MAAVDEGLLIERARSGDARAFSELVRAHEERLFAFLARWLADRAAAEDVLQDATVRALASMTRFRPDAPFRPWLFRIAINEAKDYLRRQERARRRGEVWEAECVERQPRTITGEIRMQETIELGLGALKERDRRLILLRFGEDMTLSEMSQVLGVPTPILRMQVHRARERFRKVVGSGG
jgi:RNA polymerase sigma-70 factor, ECF subfamily